jgi:plastocyanin domain-containing protein
VDTAEIVVLVGGIAAIAAVLWYFFGAREGVAATETAGGVQEVDVTVKGGYSPDTVVVRAGRPVRLRFHREESASCSDQVVFADFGIARDLPAFQTTAVEFTPKEAGEFAFTCGMRMLRGKLIVQPA